MILEELREKFIANKAEKFFILDNTGQIKNDHDEVLFIGETKVLARGVSGAEFVINERTLKEDYSFVEEEKPEIEFVAVRTYANLRGEITLVIQNSKQDQSFRDNPYYREVVI